MDTTVVVIHRQGNLDTGAGQIYTVFTEGETTEETK